VVVPRDDPPHQGVGRPREEHVAVEERVVPLAVLLDRFALKVLSDLVAAVVGDVPAARVHVKKSIEAAIDPQLLDNMLYRMRRRIAHQYS
jgi:hypothetical protein